MSILGKNEYERNILHHMLSEILKASTNDIFNDIYKSYKLEYDFIKNYSIIVGSDDELGSNFHTNILSELNSKKFYDFDGTEIIVEHPLSSYKNVLYLTDREEVKIKIGSSAFIDSNSIGMFRKFYNKDIINNFIEFKLTHNIDMNYLPYILEDYINPHHSRPNPKVTVEKIKAFEIVNNLDYELYKQTKEKRVNEKLLKLNGLKNIDEHINNRIFWFTHFFDKGYNKYNILDLPGSSAVMFSSEEKFPIYSLLSQYYIIFGYLLKILIEKNKRTSTKDKIKNVYHQMILNGLIFEQVLTFAYDYFEDVEESKTFFIFDKSWSYEKIIKEHMNNAWDIYLYYTAEQAISINKQGVDNQKIDFTLSFFLTMDNNFYSAYIKKNRRKMFVINESISGRPYVSIAEPSDTTDNINLLVNEYLNENNIIDRLKFKRSKLYNKHSYSMAIIFKEQMQRELKIELFE